MKKNSVNLEKKILSGNFLITSFERSLGHCHCLSLYSVNGIMAEKENEEVQGRSQSVS
jgi:hypothetical protein